MSLEGRTTMDLGMGTLSKHLARYGARLVMNAPDASELTEMRFLREPVRTLRNEVLYLVDADSLGDKNILKSAADFLVVGGGDAIDETCFGERTNAIFVTGDEDERDIVRSVEACIDAFTTLRELAPSFMQKVLDKDAFGILEIASQALENPLGVINNSNEQVYVTANGLADGFWERVVKRDFELMEQSGIKLESSPRTNNAVIGAESYPILYKHGDWVPWLNAEVNINGAPRYVITEMERDRRLGEIDLPILAYVADLVSHVLSSEGSQATEGERLYPLLNNLVSGERDESSMIKATSEYGGYLRPNNWLLMIFNKVKSTPYVSAVTRFCEAEERLPHNIVFLHGYCVLILLGSDEPTLEMPKSVLKLIDRMYEKGWQSALSYSFNSFDEIRTAYEQCVMAARFGVALDPLFRTYSYGDYAPLHLIRSTGDKARALSFCLPLVRRVQEYDEENSTDYLGTLRCYLKSHNDYNEVAASLGIHRNTVAYRIARLQEVFGIDCANVSQTSSLIDSVDILECLSVWPDLPE
jgi:hypothetical protein